MNKKLIQQMGKLQEQSINEREGLEQQVKKLNQLVKQGEQDKQRANDLESELDNAKSSLT